MDAVKQALRIAKAEGGGSTGDAAAAGAGAPAFDPTAFVSGLYQTGMGRAPTAEELSPWVGGLNTNALTQAQVQQQIQNSPEYQVKQLYPEILNRGFDPGAEQWINAVNSGAMTLPEVREAIGQSPENQVQDLFSSLLGRSLDPGANAYIEGIASGTMTGQQVKDAIMQSEEYKRNNPGAATGTTTGAAGTTTGAATDTTTGTANKGGMPLVYVPPAYKDYGATAAAFRVASGLENLPGPFATMSPVIGGNRYQAPTPGIGSGINLTYQQIADMIGSRTGGGSAGGGAGGGTTGGGTTTGGTTGGGTAGGTTTGGGTSTVVGAGGNDTVAGGAKNDAVNRVSDIANFYQKYLTRGGDAAELQTWADAVTRGDISIADAEKAIQSSPEAQVVNSFQNLLGRPLDPTAQGFVDAVASGQMTKADVDAAIKASPEGQVYESYKTLLGRGMDPMAQGFVDAVATGQMTKAQVDQAIKSSPEYATNQINRAYETYLGRTAAPEEAAQWANAVTSGGMGLGDAVRQIGTSQEALGATTRAADPITQAYAQFLGRAPETGAAEAWKQAVASGQMTVQDAIAAIANSEEAQRRAMGFKSGGAVRGFADGGDTTDYNAMITDMFRKYLNRDPEAQNLTDWTGALSQKISSPEAMEYFLRSSPEYTKTNPYDALVYSAYKTFLGRSPDEAGYNAWVSALKSGDIAPSDFQSRFMAAGYEDDVVNAYRDLLGREPEPSAIQEWNAALNKGMTPEQMRQSLQGSQEYRVLQNVPRADAFSEKQGGGMYNIDIGNVERIPTLQGIPAPINVKQAWENSEIERLKKELDAAKMAGTSTQKDYGITGGGGGGDGGSNFGGSDSSGTAGGVNGSDYGGGSGDSPGNTGGSPAGDGGGPMGAARGGTIGNNAVDNALRLLKADRR